MLRAPSRCTQVQEQLPGQAIFIATAAVADYRPLEVPTRKIKKTAAQLTLQMTRTTDILAWVAARADRPFVVGFAAETDTQSSNMPGKSWCARTSI
jgi:phosphopantothenoylcysteine decarboxylase / phosphopantothenate---cysteine ligase